jgi:DNA-binding NarL/FixJ family response regulator
VLDHIRRFREEHPQIPVVAVLAELTVSTYASAVHVGATAALGEQESAEELVLVLKTALQGRAAVPERLVRAMAARIPISPKSESWLEPGQDEWLRHLSRGEPISELADNIGYSEREMFRMLHDLYVRIGVRNRTEAIIWATRHGVLDEEAAAD